MDKKSISGSLSLLILQLLSRKDMYGYEMIEALNGESGQVFDLKAGTLYPLLHGLEREGNIASYEETANGKLRRYYRLTPMGRGELARQKKEWQAYAAAVAWILREDSYGEAGQ